MNAFAPSGEKEATLILGEGVKTRVNILVVSNVVESDQPGGEESISDQASALVKRDIEAALRQCGYTTVTLPIRNDLWEPLRAYHPDEWLIFNLCESIRNKAYLEPYITSVFEHLGFRYTGSDRETLAKCLHKARTKEMLQSHGLPTAPFQVFTPWTIRRYLDFPLFVKPVSEDASIGVSLNSVVHDDRSLRRQVRYIWEMYQQPALVEEFLEGREFNVTVLGNDPPCVLPLSEINFRRIANPFARIVSYRAKWESASDEYLKTPPTCPARVNGTLRAHIEEVARRAYQVMGLRDYGRIDIRVKDGIPCVLEVNPNADLSADAGIARAARAAGMSYADLADEIVRLAARRYRLKGFARPRLVNYELKARSAGSDGIYSIPVHALLPSSARADKVERLRPTPAIRVAA